MTKNQDMPEPRVEVISASPDQEAVLSNLLELYAHDFSEFHGVELGMDGRFGYQSLPLYWSDPDRHPFLITLGGKLAGLALVNEGLQTSGEKANWDMTEFFVVRGYRRLGIGTEAAHEVWRRFPGQWQVRVMERNHSAQQFWGRAISEFAGEVIHPLPIEKGGQLWRVFSFESKPLR